MLCTMPSIYVRLMHNEGAEWASDKGIQQMYLSGDAVALLPPGLPSLIEGDRVLWRDGRAPLCSRSTFMHCVHVGKKAHNVKQSFC